MRALLVLSELRQLSARRLPPRSPRNGFLTPSEPAEKDMLGTRALLSRCGDCVPRMGSWLRHVTTDTASAGLSPPPAIFTAEHLEMQKWVRRIIDEDINPYVDQWEAEGQFPVRDVFKKLGKAGFLCMTREPKYGGAGLDFTHQIAVAEELGNIRCGAIPMAVQVQDMATPALAKYGSPELKEQFLKPSIAGDFVACLGVSEVQAGSDVAAVRTVAVRDGDDYVINGGKMWTTNGKTAHWMCLLANTAPAGGVASTGSSSNSNSSPYTNKTLIVLPMGTPGVTTSPKLDKLGMRSSDTCQVFLEDVRVPQAYRIGEEGRGFFYQMEQFQEERMILCAAMVRQLECVIEECARYTSERRIFGQPVLVRA
jgi:citronellyl-CoA dehydrogenase